MAHPNLIFEAKIRLTSHCSRDFGVMKSWSTGNPVFVPPPDTPLFQYSITPTFTLPLTLLPPPSLRRRCRSGIGCPKDNRASGLPSDGDDSRAVPSPP